MSISLTHGGLPEGVHRKDLLSALDAAGPKLLKLSTTAHRLLKCFILKCRPSDFLKGRICGTWDRPANIAADLGIDRRVLNNAERLLEEQGFITRTWTLHTARNGCRREGRILFLAGINLAPLIDGFAERVATPLAEASLQRQAVQVLQFEISGLWRRIRALGDEDGLARAETILPRGRKSRISNKAQLESLKNDLEALLATISAPVGTEKSSGRSEESFAPNILPADSSRICSSEREPRSKLADVAPVTPTMAARLASKDYRALLAANGGPTWPNLIRTSATACSWLGISHQVWGDACMTLGRERAALCVLAIDRTWRLPKDHRYRAREPGRCIRGMVRKGAASLNLVGLLRAAEASRSGDPGNEVIEPPPVTRQSFDGAKKIREAAFGFLARLQTMESGGRR